MAEDWFGNIKIDRERPPEDGPEVPLEKDDTSVENATSNGVTVAPSGPEQKHYRRIPRKKSSFTLPVPSRRMVAWISLIPLLIILYGVGSYFLVPVFFKGMLVSKMSNEFQRPVDVGRVVFSPFDIELRIDALTVGPQQGDVTGKDLIHFENGHFDFSLRKIFQGKLVCSQTEIDDFEINMVRHKDSILDLKSISNLLLPQSDKQRDQHWPVWLAVDEIRVSNGRVHIDDRVANKVFTIEQIQLYIPSAETREADKTAVPKLSAVVDSSPFEINAVRLQNQTGAWSTGFSFDFRSVILSKFRDILPLPESGFQLADGEADMSLDFILPEIQQGTNGVVIEGETALKNIQWHDPETQTVITLPQGKVVYRIIPSEKLFRFINVELYEPEINLKQNEKFKDENPWTYFYDFFGKIVRSEESLVVESLLVNNGKLVVTGGAKKGSNYVWNDLTLSVQNLTTAGHRIAYPENVDPAKYTLRARDIATKPIAEFYSEGELGTDAALKGNLKITGFDTARYAGLLPETSLTLQKGTSDISLYFEYDGYADANSATLPVLKKIFGGKFKTTGYVLNRDKKQAAAGEQLSCEKFHFDTNSRTIVCEKLELSKSKIYPDSIFVTIKDKPAVQQNGWDILINDLAVDKSTVYLPLHKSESDKKKKATQVIVAELDIEASSLQAKNVADNIKASGKIDKKGKLAVSGGYSYRTGQGSLQIELTGMDLTSLQPYYTSWFVPEVSRGIFGANGMLTLPTREFRGKVYIDDLLAKTSGNTVVSWDRIYSSKLLYKREPLAVQIEDLLVRRLSVKSGLSSGEGPMRTYLELEGDRLPESVSIRLIRLEDASLEMSEPLIYPGYQPKLSGINGTLALSGSDSLDFILDGKINVEGIFSIKGSSSFKEVGAYELETQKFSLVPFSTVLQKDAGFSGRQARASWKQKMNVTDSITSVNTEIRVREVVPDFSSTYSSVLSLLINKENSFTVEYSEESPVGKTHPFLLEQFITRLHNLQVKAALSPALVLKAEDPTLELDQTATFAPGKAILGTESNLFSDYRKLFNTRPYVMLSLQGQYDPVIDHNIIQSALQEEADRQREIENKRRALEKVRILQSEMKRLKEMKAAAQQGEVIEEIIPSESREDLEPLPQVIIKVDTEVLIQLARQRAQVVRDYLVHEIKLDPDRVKIDTQIARGTPSVQVSILPYEPAGKGKDDDTSTH